MQLSKSMKKTSRGDVEVKLNIRFVVSQLSENRTIRVELDLNDIAPQSAGVSPTDYAASFRDYALAYTGKDVRMVRACAIQFEAFCHDIRPMPEMLTAEVCQDFYEFLTSRLNGSTPANYFKKFRRFLDTESGGCGGTNPAAGVKLHYDDYRPKGQEKNEYTSYFSFNKEKSVMTTTAVVGDDGTVTVPVYYIPRAVYHLNDAARIHKAKVHVVIEGANSKFIKEPICLTEEEKEDLA